MTIFYLKKSFFFILLSFTENSIVTRFWSFFWWYLGEHTILSLLNWTNFYLVIWGWWGWASNHDDGVPGLPTMRMVCLGFQPWGWLGWASNHDDGVPGLPTMRMVGLGFQPCGLWIGGLVFQLNMLYFSYLILPRYLFIFPH